MNKSVKSVISILISILFAGGLMYFALKKMEWSEIKSVFQRANYGWVALAMSLQLVAYWIRAARWNILLEPMNYKISTWNGLLSIAFGYLMNIGIPRSGEVARASALYKMENIPITSSFGTIINERIVDMVFMLISLGLTAIFSYPALMGFFDLVNQNPAPVNQEKSYTLYYAILGLIIVGGIIFMLFRDKILQIPLVSKIFDFLKNLFLGILSIFKLKKRVEFILLSLGIWVCYFFSGYLMIFSLDETSFLSIKDGFFLLTVSTLGMMIPASGGFGAFHTALRYGFAALFLSLGLSQEDGEKVGLSYAFLTHSIQILLMLIVGLISIPFIFKKKQE